MQIYDKYGKMIDLQEKEDTGWISLEGNDRLRGSIKNGIATIVFENFSFQSKTGEYTKIFTLPKEYAPNTNVYFSLIENSAIPKAYMVVLDKAAEIYTFALKDSNNIVGSISYPVK